jgi:hypothetical protein
MRAAEDIPESPAREQIELLNRKYRLFEQIQQKNSIPVYSSLVPALRCYHRTENAYL